MQILDLVGMYFDTVVVFVTNSSLLFSFTLAIHTVTRYDEKAGENEIRCAISQTISS